MTDLHAAVKEIAGNNPALVLSIDALRELLFKSFLEATERLHKISVPIEGFSEIAARLDQLSNDDLTLSAYNEDDQVVVKVTPDLTATIGLHLASDKTLEFSTIQIEVRNLRFAISASAPNLLLSAPDFDVSGKITTSATRESALNTGTIQKCDIERIEGAMAYVMPRGVAKSVLSTIDTIDLAERFTAFELRGDWILDVVNDNLVIRPSLGIALREDIGCPITDSAPHLSTKVSALASSSDTHYSWKITGAGVSKPKIREAHDKVGFAALYAPKLMWDARFSKVIPGVVYRERNNGFIGYELTFTVGLKYLRLKIDPDRFGLVIDFGLVTSGAAFLTIDVPCVGRCDLAYARFSSQDSDLSVLLSFMLQPPGKLVLESQIDRLNIAKVDATVSGFSRWLALAGGKAAVVGFIVDYVLKRVIERNLPIKICDAIKRELNSKNFELLDFEELATFTEYGYGFNGVSFSGDCESVLVGLGSYG